MCPEHERALDVDSKAMSIPGQIRALLIGGSGVLGRHIAARLISNQISVIVHGGRNRYAFQKNIIFLKNINANYVKGVWMPIINHQRFYQKMIKYLPVEIMIILYGPYMHKPISSTTYRDWETMAIGNFILPAACLSANMEFLQNTQYGRVIGFASDYRTAMGGYRKIAAYAAAKWALSSTFQSAATQNTNPYARFYLLAPGYIDYQSPRIASSNNSKHQYSADDVARGVIALLDQKINKKSGSVIRLDRIVKIK